MTTEKLPDQHPLPVSQGHFELADVTLVEQDRRLLADASLSLDAGSTNYVLGSSSEERSALLRLLLGVENPTSGSIRLDGTDLKTLSLARTREAIRIALSDPWLTSGTIADNIAFGHRRVGREQIARAAKLACVDSFVDEWELGLDTAVAEEAPELTVGQRRLVALARAVVGQPAVLLIEEPTKGLDAQEETLAIQALQQVAKGRTTVVAAQRLHYARRPNRLLRIERGRLTEDSAAPLGAPIAPQTGRVESRASRRLDVTRPAGALDAVAFAKKASAPTVAGFEPVRLLERSSYTETWLAWDEQKGNQAQLKVARRAPVTYAALQELSREYRTAESLRHPGLARPITADFGQSLPYAVYEYVDGQTLAELIKLRGGALPPDLVLRVGYELARTLTYIHQRGYSHLDLRPEITMVTPHGTIITDLKMTQSKGARCKRIYRQDQYGVVAAEQLRGHAAAPSMDIFALGAVLYQAANGVLSTDRPGTVNSHRQLASDQYRPQPALPVTTGVANLPALGSGADTTIPSMALDRVDPRIASQAALATIIERLTATEPALRPSAEQALGMLRQWVLPVPVGRSRPGRQPRQGSVR